MAKDKITKGRGSGRERDPLKDRSPIRAGRPQPQTKWVKVKGKWMPVVGGGNNIPQ